MTDRKQDLTDRYIRGEMTADERAAFEKQLNEDEELSEMYKYTLRVARVVKDRNEKLAKIKEWESASATPHADGRRYRTITFRVVYAVLCAAVVIGVFMFIGRRPSMPELNMQQYECYRGCSGVAHVAELINEEKYDNALYVIEDAEKDCLSDIDSVKNEMHSASRPDLERMKYEISASQLDYDEMCWLKVYALVGLERYDEASDMLREISRREGRYKVQADSLLNIIND